MASVEPIILHCEDLIAQFPQHTLHLEKRFVLDGEAMRFPDFKKAVSSVTVPITIHWTPYGRLKIKQLCGERLTRRQRKRIWNYEHARTTK